MESISSNLASRNHHRDLPRLLEPGVPSEALLSPKSTPCSEACRDGERLPAEPALLQ